ATASGPIEAAAIANAFAHALKQVRAATALGEIKLQTKTLEVQSEEAKEPDEGVFAKEFQRLQLLQANLANATQIVEPATPPAAPTSPRPKRNAAMALILALLLAAALAPLLDRLDRRIRNPSELEELLEAPVLSVVSDDAFPGHPPNY